MWKTYLQKIKILVVDDQDFLRSVLRQILGVLGARRISEATDGEAAWVKILSNPPDLVIVDWEMEGVDGIELVRRIRHDKDSPDRFLPIIMLTAYSEHPRITAARDAGVNEFVVKPISAKTLFSRLNSVIEHPRRYINTKNFFGPDRRRRDVHVKVDRRKPIADDETNVSTETGQNADQPVAETSAV